MKVLVKIDSFNVETILNIIYNDLDDKWTTEYLDLEIEKIKKTDNDCEVFYEICDNNYTLIKKDTVINKGYLYNTNTSNYTVLFTIKELNFDFDTIKNFNKNIQENNPYTKMFIDINNEINRRLIKELDKDSLFNLIIDYNNILQTKNDWTKDDLILLQNNIVKKQDLSMYSILLKKMKKYKKKQNRKNKSPNVTTDPELFNSCKLEYIIVNK
jgi:hypothetical protein